MLRSALTTAMAFLLLLGVRSPAAAQQDRIGADATMTAVGVQTHVGRRVTYVCPAITATQIAAAEVWGSDVYESDSPICIAGIHAGVLQAGRPGVVTIVITPGADEFKGSARNGVTTKDYGPNASAYSFDRTGTPGQIDWATKGLNIPETFAASIPVVCPGSGAMTYLIWGSDVYQEDSSICTAAVHVGLITKAKGGKFFVSRVAGGSSYPSLYRNGVQSTAWSEASASFRVDTVTTALIATAVNAPAPMVVNADTSGCKVANLKVVATSPTAVRATWDGLTSGCKTMALSSGELLSNYLALHWPTGDATGCPASYSDAKRFTRSADSTFRSTQFPGCTMAVVPPSSISFDDHYGFEGGPYSYRLWPIYRALCEFNSNTCPLGTVDRPKLWSDASVALPLSNRIDRLDRNALPSVLPAPSEAWGRQYPSSNLRIRLGWYPVAGAAFYRVTRVKNTGDPETTIAQKPPIEFAQCIAYGCDVYADDFPIWSIEPGSCSADFCRFEDHDVVIGLTYSYRIWPMSGPDVLGKPSQVVTVTTKNP